MRGNKILKMMKDISTPNSSITTDLVFGEVIKEKPLEIKIDNRYTVDETFLILSHLCKETIIKIPKPDKPKHFHIIPEHETEQGGSDNHTHRILAIESQSALNEIMLWRGLKVGDKVRMLRVNQGQMFYVLEREGEL